MCKRSGKTDVCTVNAVETSRIGHCRDCVLLPAYSHEAMHGGFYIIITTFEHRDVADPPGLLCDSVLYLSSFYFFNFFLFERVKCFSACSHQHFGLTVCRCEKISRGS